MFGNKLKSLLLLSVVVIAFFPASSGGGLISWTLGALGGYGACQSACNAAYVICIAATGIPMGLCHNLCFHVFEMSVNSMSNFLSLTV